MRIHLSMRDWKRCTARKPIWRAVLAALLVVGACRESPLGEDQVATGEDIERLPHVDSVAPPPGTLPLINFDPAGNRLTRFDVEGNAVDAHGGEIRRFGDTYYWYGEHYGCGFEWTIPGTPFCGFRVYSSPDLVHWTDRGALFDVTEHHPWQARCQGRTNGCFRPHVLYNPTTKRYVLWINAYDAPGGFYVMEATSPTGPFEDRGFPRLTTSADAFNGDHNLFADDDGTAYLVYTDWRKGGDLMIEVLGPDFLTGTGRHMRLGLHNVEAPSMFKRAGRYYITMSDPKCGYCTTGTSYVSAPTPLGPWSAPKKLTTTSCGGQPAHVAELPAHGGGSWYLYMSDLWNNGEKNEATGDQFWAALSFDSSGEIGRITCAPYNYAPVLTREDAPTSRARAERHRLQCDIGAPGTTGRVQREVRFTPGSTSRLRSVSFTTYQKGSPTSPLILQILSVPDGQVLQQSEIEPARVSWAARQVIVPAEVTLTAGRTYAVRASATLDRGCYGIAFRDDLPPASLQSFVSTNGGANWTIERNRPLKVSLSLESE
ncbi:MAG: family 43 glycosylhydrolase [Gemmatimonadetes bacterium]|nr:family 43 glycosylhydrolase [Gemmatimonadota bacterium]